MSRLLGYSLLTLALVTPCATADTFLLVIKSGTIADTKANGCAWDIFCGAPDPYVKVWVYERSKNRKLQPIDYGETMYMRDTYTPVWNKEVAKVQEGDLIRLQVWDKDLRYDDLIGEYRFTLTRKRIEQGTFALRFDQVKELRLQLRPDD